MKRLKFFLDFDGTVSKSDVVDLVLEKFAPAEWRGIEREWVQGLIGSRECLTRQIELISASPASLDALVDGIGLDPGFEGFLSLARKTGVPVAIVSDGFDLFIRRILQGVRDKSLLEELPIFSNKLAWNGGRVEPSFPAAPCAHGCANCKPQVLAAQKGKDDFIAFVGDGLSDRFASQAADLTFAKGKLLDHCRQTGVRCRPYEGFAEIEKWLDTYAKSRSAMEFLHQNS